MTYPDVDGDKFLLTPLREGRPRAEALCRQSIPFLLTPLREGRHEELRGSLKKLTDISTHAPAGGATSRRWPRRALLPYFYSRPCGRGDLQSI